MSNRWYVISVIGVAATLMVFCAPYGHASDLVFYEGNGCSQDIVFVYSSKSEANDNCKNSGACKGDNDEARSLLVKENAGAGAVVTVYDSPDGRRTDDWAKITVGRASSGDVCVRTFEDSTLWRSGSGRAVRVEYARKNGLDGKVSRVQVAPAPDIPF